MKPEKLYRLKDYLDDDGKRLLNFESVTTKDALIAICQKDRFHGILVTVAQQLQKTMIDEKWTQEEICKAVSSYLFTFESELRK